MKKFVLKLDLHDDKAKQKALKTVSTLSGRVRVKEICKLLNTQKLHYQTSRSLRIDSIAMDMKEKKLTVIGTVDPITVVSKLRKYWQTDIISVGPANPPEKKEEPKKEEPKKEEGKKEEGKKAEEKKDEGKKEEPKKEEKKEEGKKEEEKKKEAAATPPQPDPALELVKNYRAYYPAYNPYHTTYYYVHSVEETPNACVIC